MHSSISKSLIGLVALVSFAGGGCALQPGAASGETSSTEDGSEASVKTTGEAVTVSCNSSIYSSCSQNTDSTGTIITRVYQCKFVGPAELNTAECPVEAGFVLVGGGGEIEGDTPLPGALLTASFPENAINDGNHVGTTWLARSKDHLVAFSHRLRAYAIGLQLQGVSAASLNSQIFYRVVESAGSSHAPTATAVDTRSGDIIIGGGAEAVYHSAGQLLTGSFSTGTGWTASSKDHGISDLGQVEAFVLGLPPCPTGYTRGCLHATSVANGAMVGPGYATHLLFLSSGIGTSIGAQTTFNGFGRMVSSLFPIVSASQNGVTLISKDHQVEDTGQDLWQVVGLAAN